MITDDNAVIEQAIKKILFYVSDFNLDLSPPVMGQKIHEILRNITGNEDPYRERKNFSIKKALEYVNRAKNAISSSSEPFHIAAKYSIAGNIMDFALLPDLNDSRIDQSLEFAHSKRLDSILLNDLYCSIESANIILFLGDNAGETVFDRLFIETFPGKAEIYYAVRGSAVINDAIYDDAVNSGLQEVSVIISNGDDSPGTVLKRCSNEFLEIFEKADVIISKGQGNLETLNDCEKDIFFLTQIKCPVIAERQSLPLGEWVITKSALLKKID